MVYNNQLICYYSDQRDPAHGQKLVHQVSSDLKTWGPIVNDEANPNYSARPGMPTVSKMSNGQYFFTYENGGAPEGQSIFNCTNTSDNQETLPFTSRLLATQPSLPL